MADGTSGTGQQVYRHVRKVLAKLSTPARPRAGSAVTGNPAEIERQEDGSGLIGHAKRPT